MLILPNFHLLREQISVDLNGSTHICSTVLNNISIQPHIGDNDGEDKVQ